MNCLRGVYGKSKTKLTITLAIRLSVENFVSFCG